MIDLGAHWEFILAAYLGAGVVVLGLIGWASLDAGRTRARLKALEAIRAKKGAS